LNWSDHTIDDSYKKLKLTPLQRKILDTVRRYPTDTYGQIAARCSCGESHAQRTVANFKAGAIGERLRKKLKYDGELFGTQTGGGPTREIPCNMCGKLFISRHKGNRRCDRCSERLREDPDYSVDFLPSGYSIYSVFEDRAAL
jgi:hypothetical protein